MSCQEILKWEADFETVSAAASTNDLQTLKVFLEKGYHPNYATVKPLRLPLLHYAIQGNAKDCIAYLVEIGGDTREEVLAQSPFHVMVQYIKVTREYMELFLKAGFDVNSKDKRGCTPLHFATKPFKGFSSQDHRLENVNMLIHFGADIESRDTLDHTPFLIACSVGNVHIVDILVKKKCDYLAVDYYGLSGVHTACVMGHLDVVKYLHGIGCSMNTFTNDKHRPLTERSVRYGWYADNFEERCDDHVYRLKTPLMIAVLHNYLDIVKYLVNVSDISLKDSRGCTALHISCFPVSYARGSLTFEPIIKILLDKGGNINELDTLRRSPGICYLQLAHTLFFPDGVDDLLLFLLDKGMVLEKGYPCLPYFKWPSLTVRILLVNNFFSGLSTEEQKRVHRDLFCEFLRTSEFHREDFQLCEIIALNMYNISLFQHMCKHGYRFMTDAEVQSCKSMENFVKYQERNPFHLKHICHLALRKFLKTPLKLKLGSLNLPKSIVNYVMYDGVVSSCQDANMFN